MHVILHDVWVISLAVLPLTDDELVLALCERVFGDFQVQWGGSSSYTASCEVMEEGVTTREGSV